MAVRHCQWRNCANVPLGVARLHLSFFLVISLAISHFLGEDINGKMSIPLVFFSFFLKTEK